jgi:ecotin
MKTILTTIVFCLLLTVSSSRAADSLKGFPLAGEGMVRFVLPLPMQDDESLFNLELIVGKTVRIDAQNNYFFAGKIEEDVVLGWGFNYYRVATLGPMTGTLMAADTDAPKVDRFVTLGGNPYLIRYNSRLPVVIYVPEGVEVRYRLWSAGPEIRLVDEG